MRIMAGATHTRVDGFAPEQESYKVWINDKQYDNVVAVDTEQGFALVQLCDRDGKHIPNGHGGGQLAILYGKVELRKPNE
jgi:hypothetical protein